MSHTQTAARTKKARSGRSSVARSAADRSPAPGHAPAHGAFSGAGPAVALGGPVQTKVEVGPPDDAYEREADAVANRVMAGATPGNQAAAAPTGVAQKEGAKTPEQEPVRKQELSTSPEEKETEPPTVQSETADQTRPEEPTAQPARMLRRATQEPEQKQPPTPSTVQKQGLATTPEEKNPEQSVVQKEDASSPAPEADEKQAPSVQTVRRMEEQTPAGGPGPVGPGPAPAATPGTMSEVAEEAIATAGPGRPMEPKTRAALESHLNEDLSDVRVHDDAPAQQAARDLNARAFTHGQDIWLAPGESDSDLGLMAHEVTHVVQQRGGARRSIQRKVATAAPSTGGVQPGIAGPAAPQNDASRSAVPVVQRTNGGTAGSGKPKPGKDGKIEGQRIIIPEIKLPNFKVKRHGGEYKAPLTVPKAKKADAPDGTPPEDAKKAKRETKQISKWRQAAKAGSDAAVEAMLKGQEKNAVLSGTSNQQIYFLKSKSADFYLFGTVAGIKSEARLPYWDRAGKERLLEVDHKKEIQLGGTDSKENYELLDADANWSSGISIRSEIIRRVGAAVAPYVGKDATQKIWDKPPNLDTVLTNYEVTFEKVQGKLPLKPGGKPDQYWGLGEVSDGEHLKQLKVMTEKEITKAGLLGSETNLAIYTASRGGTPRFFKWKPGETTIAREVKDFYPGFTLKEVTYTPQDAEGAKVGEIKGEVFKKGRVIKAEDKPLGWTLRKAPGIGFGGYIDDISILETINKRLGLKGMSPIAFREAGLDATRGLYAVGQVLPTVPLISKAGIDLVIQGDDVRLRKLFSTGEFSFPGPIQVTDSSLEVSAGTSGLGVAGYVQFEIQRVGQGKLGAEARTGLGQREGGFAIEGEFNFDTKLFDEAKIEAWYRDNDFGAKGRLAINKEGKVKGIKSAAVEASYGKGQLQANGTAQLSVPGVKSVALALSYSQEEGLAIGGSFELADNIPGIKSGSGTAMIKQRPNGDGYDVKATGKAVPSIPGVDATLAIAYENGAITIEGSAAYAKGMLKGSVMVGVTNRPIDAQGKPAGEPGTAMTVYGGGTVTIRIAPWLQGTVGIRLLPNGEMEVSGEIGLPSSLDIFPEKRFDRNIFKIGIDIPIVGVAVAGQRIGIFANISGGLDLSAGIGPARLEQMKLGITYNPAHEDQTRVVGQAALVVPAHAGLRLFVRGGLGVGIPIVSAQAGIEIGGRLGLEGALSAGVQVDWTPTQGLRIDAVGQLSVEPKLKFDVTGYVLVEADLLLTTIELYSKRWQLAAFEYGSGLRFGVRFPIHYEEGKPFDISLSDLQFQVPDIQPQALLGDLIKRIA